VVVDKLQPIYNNEHMERPQLKNWIEVWVKFSSHLMACCPNKLPGSDCFFSRVTEYKYLGLCIDSRLNWSSHIGHITKKISPYIGVFRTISFYVFLQRFLIYISLMCIPNSHISYLTCIWGTATNCKMNVLQRLQNKAVKYLYSLPRLHPTVLLYNSRILPVSFMSSYDMLTTVYRIRCGHLKFNSPIILVSDTHSHNTRSSSNMLLRCYRCSTDRKNIFYAGFRLFNELPPHVRQLRYRVESWELAHIAQHILLWSLSSVRSSNLFFLFYFIFDLV
jgi:hypothetical protein